MMHALSTAPLITRSAAPMARRSVVEPRKFWLVQARFWLRQARMWSEQLGGPEHAIAAHWYLDAPLRAERYQRWAHELAPALVDVDALLEGVS